MLGHSMLGLVAWAQKFYLTSRLPIWNLPEQYHQLGGSMAWSCGDMRYIPLSSETNAVSLAYQNGTVHCTKYICP